MKHPLAAIGMASGLILLSVLVETRAQSHNDPLLQNYSSRPIRFNQTAIWNDLIVPGATPRAIITRLNQVVVQQLKLSEVRERFATLGAEILTCMPEVFDAFIRAEMTKWEKVIKASGMRTN